MPEIAHGVHTFDRPLRFLGLEVGTRMTVLETQEGLLIHSPIDTPPENLSALGEPRWVLSPNRLHHLFAGDWIKAGVEGWAAPGLPEKRPDLSFSGVVKSGTQPFGSDIEVITLTCFPLSNEVVLFHKPSKTLVVTDLLFNFPKSAPFLTRAAMFCSGCYPGCKVSLLERVGMKRAIAREEIGAILEFDFERIIMAHGDVVEKDARQVFARAYRWLGLS